MRNKTLKYYYVSADVIGVYMSIGFLTQAYSARHAKDKVAMHCIDNKKHVRVTTARLADEKRVEFFQKYPHSII